MNFDPNSQIQKNVDLSSLNSWRVGGSADYFFEPQSMDELERATSWACEQNLTVTILSGGTNVLISDKGIRGLTLNLRRWSGIEKVEDEPDRLVCVARSGTPKSELLRIFLARQLAPALFLAGLPGGVGGGVVMNAGVAESLQPREFGELVDWVEVLEAEKLADQRVETRFRKIPKGELEFTYRHCSGWKEKLKSGCVVMTRVGLSWEGKPMPEIREKVRELNRLRSQKQPLDLPSCGSVFVNPPGEKAARLIEQAGLKGVKIGGAQVSLKHANFIVNVGSASAQDMSDLMKLVQREVELKFAIRLQTEVVYLGEW